jgi:hypothetical protein
LNQVSLRDSQVFPEKFPQICKRHRTLSNLQNGMIPVFRQPDFSSHVECFTPVYYVFPVLGHHHIMKEEERSMKTVFLAFVILFVSISAFAQGAKGLLRVGATAVAKGQLKIGETLVTRGGQELAPGVYRIAVEINSRNEAHFVLSPTVAEEAIPAAETALGKHTVGGAPPPGGPPPVSIPATIIKSDFVKGIPTSIEGKFGLESITPTEARLLFDSRQFAANAILGRSMESKTVDLTPTFLSIESPSECGSNCIEGFVRVTITNEGNSDATGKWNVVLREPRFYVGTVSDVPASGKAEVTSNTKLKLNCCAAVLDAEVHADFYNQGTVDANDSNNSKVFTVKLKE